MLRCGRELRPKCLQRPNTAFVRMVLGHMLHFALLVISAFPLTCAKVCYKPVCEFRLVIRTARSMLHTVKLQDGSHVSYTVGLRPNGSLYLIPSTFTREVPSGYEVPVEEVHTADGTKPRTIFTINDKFPGPTLEVMEGAEVVVTVVNEMSTEATSLHFHGIHMTNNPWMDGVPYISQCPILPRQSFQYRFVAEPAGTHWYHSHMDTQKANGLYGAFIVHRSQPTLAYDVITIADWYPVTSSEMLLDSPFNMPIGGPGERFDNPATRTFIFDGTEVSALQYWSTLIHGRGRKGNNKGPLHHFAVRPGTRIRIHVIMAGEEYNYRFSVDQHNLTVIEMDGHRVEPVTVDSVLGFHGESFVVELSADKPIGSYWIRATVIRTGSSPNPMPDGKSDEGLAVLRYEGHDAEQEPHSTPVECSQKIPCLVLNCPWVLYHELWYPNQKCIHVTQLKIDTAFHDPEEIEPGEDIFEVFLNFGFSIGSSINMRKNVMPRAPLFQKQSTWGTTPCPEQCSVHGCRCTHVINIPANRTVQLVMTSYGLVNPRDMRHSSMHHPVHIHGYSFQIMKIGYPVVNQTTGRPIRRNPDIACENEICSRTRWKTRPRSALLSDRPIVKNVVNVPAYGYAVLRFKSNNPGYWLLHCHQMLHLSEGMSLTLNITEKGLPPPPAGFPTCGDYSVGKDEFHSMLVKNRECMGSTRCNYQQDGACDGQQKPEPYPHKDHITCTHLLVTGFLCTTCGVLITSACVRVMLLMRNRRWVIPLRRRCDEESKKK
ncbi:laccase-4 isoform X2 [Nematostella vectensis]|uniref:laccase-4 isoform X2 n=2 Tax=Nematostella vectensis TaxID=45351 RepID=UPI00207700F1|nr:laccase-4 isoform X2 [Nematostella vectensis]